MSLKKDVERMEFHLKSLKRERATLLRAHSILCKARRKLAK